MEVTPEGRGAAGGIARSEKAGGEKVPAVNGVRRLPPTNANVPDGAVAACRRGRSEMARGLVQGGAVRCSAA